MNVSPHLHRLPAAFTLIVCAMAALGPIGLAQSGPGLPNLTYAPAELFRSIATIGLGDHGKPMMHDGFLTVVMNAPARGFGFIDISNPYAPAVVHAVTGVPGSDLPEQHTMAQTTRYGGAHVVLARGFDGSDAGGGTGIAIWDWSDVRNPRLRSSYDIPGVPGGYVTGLFWHFAQAPYVYCPAGSLGLFIIDASDPTNPFVAQHISKSQLGGFNTVLAFAVGNTLIVTNNDAGTGTGPGFARIDISDPVNPQLLYSTTNTSSPYGASLNGGRLIVPGVDGTLRMHDIDSPSFPVRHQLFPVGGTRGASAVFQDGFVHVGASTVYYKLDVRNAPAIALIGGYSTLRPIRDEDWITPLGNLVAIADDAGNGTHLVPHQSLPDTLGPSVNMVDPPDGATGQALTSRIGITLTDMVELESLDATTFAVRPTGGGAPIAGSYSHQFGIVNFVPDQPLQPNTSYEVVVPAGGIRDWAGNGTPTSFMSRFSTGARVQAIDVAARRSPPSEVEQTVTVDITSVSGSGPFRFSWNFGDGSPPTAFSTTSHARHVYAEPGHYSVLVTATNGVITATDSFVLTVHPPLTPNRPTRSSTIAIDDANGRVWCVNADNDTVTAIDANTLAKLFEVPVGRHPRTLAFAQDGTTWVACEDDATVRVLDSNQGAQLRSIPLPAASAPYGIAISPDGQNAYVALRATGEVAQLDVTSRTLVATTPVGLEPRGIAITADSRRVFVTRFISSAVHDDDEGEANSTLEGAVYELSTTPIRRTRTIPLAFDPGPDTEASGRGVPNYLNSLTISPDGRRLWVPSKKDNVARGTYRSGEFLTFDNTVRTIVSQIDLGTSREDFPARIDFNDRDMAFAVELSPVGDYAFTALQGSNAVVVTDAFAGTLVATIEGTGFAPQGLAMSRNGTRLFVHNFMSRSITAHDTSGVVTSTSFTVVELGRTTTVASERLSPIELRGKQIFYNAADPRMNRQGYISCASCHLDGGHDGRVWDFTDRGEGLRNTISLIGKGGTAHGNVHWTANFDEIQDFEHDMRGGFGGGGFLSALHWASGTVSSPLGTPKAGLSPELDALTAYVSSLRSFGHSPHRNPNGTLTADGLAGKAIFARLGCAQCHAGQEFTDSPAGMRHDVGTLSPSSGSASGSPLTALDTPTLRGLWATAPYLHDGSAPTLLGVITSRNASGLHGNTLSLSAQERRQLVAYLLQIDDREP